MRRARRQSRVRRAEGPRRETASRYARYKAESKSGSTRTVARHAKGMSAAAVILVVAHTVRTEGACHRNAALSGHARAIVLTLPGVGMFWLGPLSGIAAPRPANAAQDALFRAVVDQSHGMSAPERRTIDFAPFVKGHCFSPNSKGSTQLQHQWRAQNKCRE